MRTVIFLISIAISVPAFAQDPVKVDPAHYHVLFENEHMRVLEYRDKPGDKAPMHSHPAYMTYVTGTGKFKDILPNAETSTDGIVGSKFDCHPPTTHAGQNIGNTDTQELLVEFKDAMNPCLGEQSDAKSSHSEQAAQVEQVAMFHVVPLKSLSKLAMDKRYETVSGDPGRAGERFVIRIHAEAGYIIMPHTHPEDENIVVVKGSWALGMGDHFNRETLKPMEVGDYGFAGKKMAHFALSRTDTIIQVHGIGPFITQWVVPVYELTDKGVLMKASGADAGRLMPDAPDACFALKLGTPVRGSYGQGVIVGAQCTPGQLTQYRVEKADGQRFWAQQEELNKP